MKYPILLLVTIILASGSAWAQSGQIQYQETIKLTIELPEDMQQYANMIPSERKSDLILQFDEQRSLYQKDASKASEAEVAAGQAANVNVVMIGGGSGKTFFDRQKKEMIRADDVMGQVFLVTGAMEQPAWKILNEQKEILGYPCIKAELVRDSSTYTAWYAPQIPVSVGPDRYYGLPGAILEVSSQQEKASRLIQATAIELGPLPNEIIPPKKGKKVSEEAFRKLVADRMAEMGVGREGGSNVIIRTQRN